MALLLALAAPVAAQTGTPSAESPGNVAAGEGSATGNPSAGGGNSQSGGGVAPVATSAPAPRRVVAMPAPAAPRAMTPAVRSAPAPVWRGTPAPDRAAARARARARAERSARRERAARKARADRAARREREAARREAAMADRNAVEGPVETDSAPPAGDVEPKVELEPAASRGSSGGVSLGTDLTTPLLLLSAVAALALATRYTVRSLRQE